MTSELQSAFPDGIIIPNPSEVTLDDEVIVPYDSPSDILEYTSRESWEVQRRSYLTASEVASLCWGRPSDWRNIRASKQDDAPRLRIGNKYARWGHIREPRLMDYARTILPDVVDNQSVMTRGRYAATPDGICNVSNVPVEGKTTKFDWDDIPDGYYNQVQWQLLVKRAKRALFVWELRHEDWRGRFYAGEQQHLWVDANPKCQRELIEVAELFLSGGDPDW